MESTTLDKFSSNLFVKIFITVLGLVAGAITIYAFFEEKNVLLEYEVISDSNVLDINADVSKLDILYDSTSLNKTNENLRIITLKVINKGGQNILNNYFDEKAPIGLEVINGTIIENPELIAASNEYLRSNVSILYSPPNKITFSNTIIESEEFFTIKLLVLHNREDNPELNSIGKVAGQQEINVVIATATASENKSFIAETFEGNFWVQIVRLISYFIAIVYALIVIVFISEKVSDYKTKRKRRNLLKEFKQKEGYQYNRMDDAIFDRYQNHGRFEFERMISITNDEDQLNKRYREILEELKNTRRERPSLHEITDGRVFYKMDQNQEDLSIINHMLEDGILIKDGERLIVNQPMRSTLVEFSEFLNSKRKDDRKEVHHRDISKTSQNA